MGHYAAEMSYASPDSDALLKRYWKTRRKLEEISASKFTVGNLQKALVLLSENKTPRGGAEHHNDHWIRDLIEDMEALLPKERLKKPHTKK